MVMLLVGVGIGLLLQDVPEPQSPGAPLQAGQGAAHSGEVHEPASARMASPGARFTTAVERGKQLAAPRATTRVGTRSPIDLALVDSRRGEPRAPEYLDDTFGPDEPGLPYPEFVAEDGAREDFERYGDGPVPQSRTEAAADTTTASRTLGTDEGFEQSCQPAFSPCRRDIDCCGSAVCRSRPGTISGFFECTAG